MDKIFGQHWKSTASGILTVLLVFLGSITAALAPFMVLQPGGTPTRLFWVGTTLSSLTGALKVWIGMITQDAGVIHSDDRVMEFHVYKDLDERPDESRTEITVALVEEAVARLQK